MEDRNITQNQGGKKGDVDRSENEAKSVQITDETHDLDGLPYTEIKGIKYLCDPMIYVTRESIRLVRNLRLRDDDVWMMSYPKSGNHWCLEVITMIVNQNTTFAERPFRYQCAEYLSLDVQDVIDSYASPRVLGLHLHQADDYPREIFERKLKIVYLIRNPKDVFVSHYKMWTSGRDELIKYRKSFSDYFDLQIKGQFIHGDWFDHVLNFEKFMKSHPEYPVYVQSYEKMKEDPVSAIKGLCAFLGKPSDLAADIARVTDFDHMKKALNTGKMSDFNNTFMDSSTGGMFRKGVIGDWKNEMSPEQSARVDKVFDEKMSGSKLGELVKKYM